MDRAQSWRLTCVGHLALGFACGQPSTADNNSFATGGKPSDLADDTGSSDAEPTSTSGDPPATSDTTDDPSGTTDNPSATTDGSDETMGITAVDHFRMCAEGPGVDSDLADDGQAIYDVVGTVLESNRFRDPIPSDCDDLGLAQSLRVEDDAGDTWRIDYELRDEDDASFLLPRLDLQPGDAVTLKLGIVWYSEFGAVSHGLIASDEAGLVAFLEQGSWDFALGPDAWPGLEISRGDMVGSRVRECGLELHYERVFAADDVVRVPPGEQAVLTLAGKPVFARSVAAFDLAAPGDCADYVAPQAWAIWRGQ